ncbi:hypothetical protein HDU91_004581, partial [Kappamyces sp. JEL0680]
GEINPNPNTNGLLSAQISLGNIGGNGPWTSTFEPIAIGNNPFCSGHAQRFDGSILVAGGDNKSISDPDGTTHVVNGRRGLRIFTPCAPGSASSCVGSWTVLPDMTSERWYPTVVTLGDGVT